MYLHITDKKLFFLLVMGGIILHLFILTIPLYDDATAWGNSLTLIKHGENGWIMNKHLPVGLFIYFISSSLFGINSLSLRIVPIFFNLFSIFILYHFAKKLYDINTARISALLGLYTFLPFFASTIVDVDGSVIVFFSLVGFYSLYNYFCASKNNFWIFLFYFASTTLFFLKTRTLFLHLSFTLMIYYYTRNIKKTLIFSFLMGFFILIVLLSYFTTIRILTSHEVFQTVINRYFSHNSPQGNILYFIDKVVNHFDQTEAPILQTSNTLIEKIRGDRRRYLNLILYLTPLYILLPFFQSLQRSQKNIFPLIWLLPSVFFYFLGYPLGTLRVPRYVSVIYPALILLASIYINDYYQKYSKKPKGKISSIKIIFTILLIGILGGVILSFFNSFKSDYWYPSSSVGPIFGINFNIVLFVFIAANFLFLCFVLRKNGFILISKAKDIFVLFLIVVIGFNFFLISQPLTEKTHRNLLLDLKKYQNMHLIKQPIYAWNEDIPFYLNQQENPVITLNQPFSEKLLEKFSNQERIIFADLESDIFDRYLKNQGGTIILLNYPDTRYYGFNVSRYNENCSLTRDYFHKGGNLVIYKC